MGKALSKCKLRILNKLAVDHHVQVTIELSTYSVKYFWMTVADIVYGYTGNHVHVCLAQFIIDINAFCSVDIDQKGKGIGLSLMGKKTLGFVHSLSWVCYRMVVPGLLPDH